MSKAWKLVLGLFAGTVILTGVFTSGLLLGAMVPLLTGLDVRPDRAQPSATLPPRLPTSEIQATPLTPEDLQTLFDPFWQAWDIVHRDFVKQPVDDTALMQGAIRGMLDSLGDEHTSYLDPDMYQQASIPLSGEYEGIGAWVDPDGEYLTIVSPMPGSPAEEVGLEPGDEIIAVDGEDMTGIDGNLVIRRVLGPAGSKVVLTIRREGVADPLEFEIIRATISIPSVESQMLDEGIGYVRLYTFGEDTRQSLRQAVETLLDEDPAGLILDLRGNGGGYLQTSIDVASEFIDEGTILIERFGDGREQEYRTEGRGHATEVPLVVLVDEGSASASEIVAGAIQDLGRGLLVGETTFGKGSVQNWVPLDNDQGAVRVTVAYWYTPKGRLIQDTGLKPDIEVVVDEANPDEDLQLEKAVEVLLEKVEP
jgi:carboxyl-terminal processing protease